MENQSFPEQNVFLYSRKRLEMSGVCDVTSFSDTEVEVTLNEGCLAVEGTELKIESFSSQTGAIEISGTVSSIYYFGEVTRQKKGLFRGRNG